MRRIALLSLVPVLVAWAQIAGVKAADEAGHWRAVEVLQTSSDGKLLASGGQDGRVKLWQMKSGKLVHTLKAHRLLVSGLAFSPDGHSLASASWDGTIRIWDVRRGRQQEVLTGHNEQIRSLAFSADGKFLASGGNDKTVRLWDAESGEEIKQLATGIPRVEALAFSPDGETLHAGTGMGGIMELEIPALKIKTKRATDGGVSRLVALSGNDILVQSGSNIHRRNDEAKDDLITGERFTGDFDFGSGMLVVPVRKGILVRDKDGKSDTIQPGGKRDFLSTAITPDGTIAAAGRRHGGIEVYDPATGDDVVSIPPGPEPHVALSDPEAPVKEVMGVDLTQPELHDRWHVRDDTDALAGRDADEAGLRFEAKATPQHLAGRDWRHLETGLGNRAFDLTFAVRIDRIGGPGVFDCGLAVGLASASPGRMGKEDVAAVVGIHLDGVYAGIRKGDVYSLKNRYQNLTGKSIVHLGEGGGSKPVQKWSQTVRGIFSTERRLRLRIRRESASRLDFTAWLPDSGQDPADPWWRGTCTLPPEFTDVPLEHLFIKRIPIGPSHLGQQATGYGDILGLRGRLTDMELSPKPPVIQSLEWNASVLAPGDPITIHGDSFPDDAVVEIGDVGVPIVRREEGALEVRLPELEAGTRYPVTVARPDGLSDVRANAVPVGRFVESLSLFQASPQGGITATLEGAGFTEDVQVTFGKADAEITDVPSAEKIRLRVPPGSPGPASVSVEDDGREFSGTVPFAYQKHPLLRFSKKGLGELRSHSRKAAYKPYRARLEQLAKNGRGKPPRKGRQAAGSLESVAWHFALTEDEVDLKWLRDALPAVAEEGALGGWSGNKTLAATAFAYDVSASALDGDTAGAVQRYLMSAIDHFLKADERYDWFVTNISSTNPQANLSAMSAALVMADVHPDADAVLAVAKRNLRRYIEGSFGPDGGAIEGMGRGMEGLTDYLHAAHLLARCRDDQSLLEHPRLEAIPNLFRTVTATPNDMLRFRKVHGGLQGLAVLAELDRRTGDPLFRTLADNAARKTGHALDLGLAMQWRTDAPAPSKSPSIPTLQVLDGVEWAVMRSDPVLNSELVLGIKGGDGPHPYHSQHDVGSFTLFAGGEQRLLDPAWGQERADQHNALIVDGIAPDVAGGTIADAWEDHGMRAVVLDATRAYRPWGIRRVRRTFVMTKDGTIIILDDVLPAEDGEGRVQMLFQTPEAERAEDGKYMKIPGENGTLHISLHGQKLEWSETKNKRRHSKHVWMSRTASYENDPSRPLVTVLRFASEAGTPEPSQVNVTRTGDRATVKIADSEVVFIRTDDGWAFLRPAKEGKTQAPLLTPAPERLPPQAVAVRAETPPELDGQLDDQVWQKAESIGPLVPNEAWELGRTSEHPTETRFAWDERNLYVGIRCIEPNLESLTSNIVGPAQSVAGEDRVYLYLDPGRVREGSAYFGGVILASGMQLGMYGKQGDVGRPLEQVQVGRELEPPAAWTVEIAIPWDDLFHDPWEKLTIEEPHSGMRMGLNLLRHQTTEPREVSVWARSYPWAAAAPHWWGTLVLE